MTVFTIEAASEAASNVGVTRPIEGLMTTFGFELSDPSMRLNNRLHTWYVGGTLECISANEADWRRIVGDVHSSAKRGLGGNQQQQGIDQQANGGSISYFLPQPVCNGTYMDIVYLDETLRIVRTSGDMVCVSARVPYPDE